MPIGVCQTCKSTVRFEGSAGLCPNCGTVLRAGQRASRDPKAPSAQPSRPEPRERGARQQAVDLDEAGLGEDEEEFSPGSAGGGSAPVDPVIFYLSVGAGAVIVVFGLLFALRALLSKPDAPVAIAPSQTPFIVQPAEPEAAPPEPAAPSVPTTLPSAVAVTRPAKPPGPPWTNFKPAVPVLEDPPINDKLVGKSITRAVGYIKSQFTSDELVNPSDEGPYPGIDTLAVYSLMHAGEAVKDPELLISSDFMQRVVNRLKQFDMTRSLTTYERSLRATALAMFNRTEDLDQLTKDRDWLLRSEANGAFDYLPLPPKTPVESQQWDNSNSQYGLLGIWATAQTGMSVPDKFWVDAEQHWLACQHTDGGWGYSAAPDKTSTAMTAAGITTLCVAAEQRELIASKGKHDARPLMTRAIQRGIEWLGNGDNLLDEGGKSTGYRLYGIERAALATGYRYFGDHDWYRELGAREIKTQMEDGSFPSSSRDDGSVVETAFRILFLSRGRQPLLMNKLRFEGDWNDRPRDVAKIAQFVSAELEKPFAWGVADLSRNWQDWMECPLLFITTDTAPDFTDEDCKKLRSYTDAGGMIFFHNEYGSPEVDAFVKDLVHRVYPEYPIRKVAPDNLIYSVVYPIKTQPILGVVGNSVRPFFIYSPKDVTQDWVRYRPKDSVKGSVSLQLALNLAVVALGKSDFRNRLDSPYEDIPRFTPAATLPLYQVSYKGDWNPEPRAYERFSRWFQNQTSLKLDVQAVPPSKLDYSKTPIAVMTGTTPIEDKNIELAGLSEFVNAGGVLFIDPAGGNAAFADSIKNDLLRRAFPGIVLAPIRPYHPIFSGGSACMDVLSKPRLRNYAASLFSGPAPEIELATVGKGAIVVCPLDVTAGLLASNTYAINGYTPSFCQSLLKNVILWSLNRYTS